MKKTKDTNKGITLIALVITIIVMLILVVVTITMAVNGGLFEYAGRAGTETNTKRDAEQEFANLQPDMTYDDLINKYTGWTGNEGEKPEGETPQEPNTPEGGDDDTTPVALSEIQIGDYISNYPVDYTNVVDIDEQQFTKWRVLSKVTDANGNVTNIKIITAGVPLTYSGELYEHFDDDAALTTDFLDTQINSQTIEVNKFYQCGFNLPEGTNILRGVFLNDFTDNVQSLTYNDVGSVLGDLDPYALDTNVSEVGTILAIPLKGNSNKYVETLLGSGVYSGGLNIIEDSSRVWGAYGVYNDIAVRPVVTLNAGVAFKEATTKINNTTTYEISLPEQN